MSQEVTPDLIDLDPDPDIPYTLRLIHQPNPENIKAKPNEIIVYECNTSTSDKELQNNQPFQRTNIIGTRTFNLSSNFQFDTKLTPDETKLRIITTPAKEEEILFKLTTTTTNLKKSKLTIKIESHTKVSHSPDIKLIQTNNIQSTFERQLLYCKLCSVHTPHLNNHSNSNTHIEKMAKATLFKQSTFDNLQVTKVFPNHGKITSTTLKTDCQKFPILNYNEEPIKVLKIFFIDAIENIDIRELQGSHRSDPDKDGFTMISIDEPYQSVPNYNSKNIPELPLEIKVSKSKPMDTYLNVGLYIQREETKFFIQFILKAEYQKSVPSTMGTKRATNEWKAHGHTPKKNTLNSPGTFPNLVFENNFSRKLLNKLDIFTKRFKENTKTDKNNTRENIINKTACETLQSLKEEEKEIILSHFNKISEPLYPENFLEKWTIMVHCECNRNEYDTRFLSDISVLSISKGPTTSTIVLQVDSGDIKNAAIKATNDIYVRSKEDCIYAHVDEIHDTHSTILTNADTNLKQGDSVMIKKRTNNHNLNVAIKALSLAVKNLETFFPTNIPEPVPFVEREYFLPLNDEQKEGVHKIINAPPGIPIVITGGAGCGKTQVLTEITLRNLVDEKTILIVSPTNSGTAKLFNDILNHVSKYEDLADRNLAKVSVEGSPTSTRCRDLPCLKHESGKTHKIPSKDFIRTQDLLIVTPHVALSLALIPNGFQPDTIIYDENGFTSEMETIIALSGFLNNKPLPTIVLAGDRLQLTSSARSIASGHGNYDMSTMARLLALPEYENNPHLWCLLKKNYRTGGSILAVMKTLVYHDSLLHASQHPGSIIVINVSSDTKRKDPETSSHNPAEAVTTLETAKEFCLQLPGINCQIITYYRAQEVLLHQLLRQKNSHNNIPISSCENSQGSESDCVVLSPVIKTVKQHEEPPVQNDWHACPKRLTVCLGRARHYFILVTEVLSAIHYSGFREVIQAAYAEKTLSADEKILHILRNKYDFQSTSYRTRSPTPCSEPPSPQPEGKKCHVFELFFPLIKQIYNFHRLVTTVIQIYIRNPSTNKIYIHTYYIKFLLT